MNISVDRAEAEQKDASDALAPYRASFFIPPREDGGDSIYLCGHSLGLQPRGVARIFNEELEHWAELGVEGHFASSRPWLPYRFRGHWGTRGNGVRFALRERPASAHP